MTEYLRVGFIARPHGLKGAVKLDPLTDDVHRFKGMTEGYLELHGSYAPVRLSVLSVRPDAVVVQLMGYDTVEAAQTLRGGFLCVDRAHAAQLPEYTYFIADLIGLSVIDAENGKIYGTLSETINRGASDIYVVKTENGERMIPAVPEFIDRIEIEQGIFVRPISGMLD